MDNQSTHGKAVREAVDEILRRDWRSRRVICDYLVKMQLGHFEKSSIEMVLQKWRDSPYDLYDAYTFCQVHAMIWLGAIAMARVDIGIEPKADKEVEFHKTVLHRDNHKLFFGDFWGEKADYDGFINWREPSQFEIKRCDDKGKLIGHDFPVLEPREVPLEVGYTEGSRTLTHLLSRGALARWPYGSKIITIMVVVDDSYRAHQMLSRALLC
ncbi:MAG TPA: hypothetical protein VF627_09140 [Abditibacterium sp.]|jgi:hypothetical protein